MICHTTPPQAAASPRRQHLCKVLVVAAALPLAAAAQQRQIEPAIGAQVTLSDNVGLGPSGDGGAIIEIRPEVLVNYNSGRLRARGRAGLNSYTVIGDDTSSTLYPNVDLGATFEALREFLFIDAEVAAARQLENPFAPQNTAGNRFAYTQYYARIAPMILGDFANFSYRLRSSASWSTGRGTGTDVDDVFRWNVDGDLGTQRGRLGALYQYQREEIRFESDQTFIIELARAIGSFRVRPELSVNVRGGYEWTIFPGSRSEGAIYGAGFAWQPTPRSDLTAWWEERFFGPSWQATLSHRTPWLAIGASSVRTMSTTPQRQLLLLPGSSDIFGSLDAILTTRIPDPVERSQAVRDFMLINGLPPSLLQPVPVLSNRVDRSVSHMVSIAFTGSVNTIVLDGFVVERRAIDASGAPLPAAIAARLDEDQRGAALTYSRVMARAASLNAALLWRQTRGVGAASGLRADQHTLRVQWNQQLRPRTTGYVGARYVEYDSNVFSDYNEVAVFAGIYHRF